MTTLVTWNIPEPSNVDIVTNPATEWLALMSTCIDANSAGAGAWWEKAGYSASTPRYLILKRKSGAAGRLIFFGETGSTAHASAIHGTTAPAGGELWVGFSATSTANTPDQSWIATGPPLTASDFIKGVSCFPRTIPDASYVPLFRLNYAEHADGFLWLISQPQIGAAMVGGGGLFQDTTGATVNMVNGHGDSWASIGGDGWNQVAYGSFLAGNPGTVVIDTTYGGCVTRQESVNEQIYRVFSTGAYIPLKLLNDMTFTAYFYPIDMIAATDTARTWRIAGRFRQMCYGPSTTRETRVTDEDGAFCGYGHVHHRTIKYPAIWFTAELPPDPY